MQTKEQTPNRKFKNIKIVHQMYASKYKDGIDIMRSGYRTLTLAQVRM